MKSKLSAVSIKLTLYSSQLQFLFQHLATPLMMSGGGHDSEPSLNSLFSFSLINKDSLSYQGICFRIGILRSKERRSLKDCSSYIGSCNELGHASSRAFAGMFGRTQKTFRSGNETFKRKSIVSTACYLSHRHERRCA